PAGARDDGGAGGEGAVPPHQVVAFLLQLRARGAREDAGHAAAVGEAAVRRVDDRLHRLLQEVPADHLEASAGRYFFFVEDFRLRFGTFAPARRASDSPMAIACLRLVTFFPERPLFSVPRLRSRMARF